MIVDWNGVLVAGSVAMLLVLIVRLLPLTNAYQPRNSLMIRISDLESRYTELHAQYQSLRDEYANKLAEYTTAYTEWMRRESEYQLRIERMEAEIGRLRARLHELESVAGMSNGDTPAVVLGIWPDEGLDYHAEADALYNAGYEYRGLVDGEATRAGILRELRRSKNIRILEIGAHGTEDGIVLADGTASPGWWMRALRAVHLELAVLMACESDTVGDALINAGAPAVVSVQRAVDDAQASVFVDVLYQELADGNDVYGAVNYAKLAVDAATREMIRLRVQ